MSSPAVAEVPRLLPDSYQSAKPVLYCPKGLDRVDALLCAWVDWRRSGGGSLPHVYQGGDSWLGRLIHMVRRSTGEEKLPPRTMPRHDDELMQTLTRMIERLPPDGYDKRRIRMVIREEYQAPSWWTTLRKADKCKVSRRNYYYLLKAGKGMIDDQFPWRRIDLVDLLQLRAALIDKST